MSELQRLLREADPVASEPPPDDVEVARMRRRVLAGRCARGPATRVSRIVWSGACAGLLIVAVLVTDRWDDERRTSARSSATGSESRHRAETAPGRVQQIHFVTPGGTRVIWFLEPGNGEQEVRP